MAIYVHRHTRVLVRGITGRGFTPPRCWPRHPHRGRIRQARAQKVEASVFNTVFEAMEVQPAEASILFPAPFARDAAMESIAAGIRLLVLIPEHIPFTTPWNMIRRPPQHGGGVNTFGLVSGQCKVGIMPNDYFVPGPVG